MLAAVSIRARYYAVLYSGDMLCVAGGMGSGRAPVSVADMLMAQHRDDRDGNGDDRHSRRDRSPGRYDRHVRW